MLELNSGAHRKDIDGLRAVAILPVVLYHFNLGIFPGGFVGVDIFFVISGFVIAGSLASDLHHGRFSILNFYFKRVRRILPAYVVMALITALVCLAVLLPDDLADFGKSLIAASTFVSNIYFWKTSGYFAATAHAKPLLHTWSLSVEEQFYIFAPIGFFLIHRYGGRRWLVFLGPVFVASLLACVAAVFVAPTAGFFLLPTRAWELLLGALAALVGPPAPRARLLREGLALAGAGLVLFSLLAIHEDDPFPGWNALFPCFGAMLIIQAGAGAGVQTQAPQTQAPWLNRLLSTRPFVFIGLISYSLYLIHWPIASLARYVSLRDPTTLEACAMIAASLVLAVLSWRFVEQPFRHIRVNRRALVLSVGAVSILIGASIGGAIVLAKGAPGRFPHFVQHKISGTEFWGGDRCFNQNPSKPIDWSAAACTRIHGRRGRILVWGDSFAAQYMPGIILNAPRIDADVLQYTFAGCPPILAYFSYARVGCSISNSRVPGIVRREHIDTVVIAARWTATPSITLARLADTIAALKASGAKVYVIGQAPEFSADVQQIDYISGQHAMPGKATWPIYFDTKINPKMAAFAKGAVFIDPLSRLCDGVRCPYRDGSHFYYADYGHFSTYGSNLAVQAYFPFARAAPAAVGRVGGGSRN
jgi:peptidoglycan/LPS O-acetylase OafA/YrhL